MTLTQARLKELVEYDPLTGVFTAARERMHVPLGKRLGCVATPREYRRIRLDRLWYYEHRLAFLYMTGEWPKYQVDHINRDKGDNRWENLRDVTPLANMRNIGLHPRNKTGQRGVSLDKCTQKWQVQCSWEGTHYWFGRHADKEKACALAAGFYDSAYSGTLDTYLTERKDQWTITNSFKRQSTLTSHIKEKTSATSESLCA